MKQKLLLVTLIFLALGTTASALNPNYIAAASVPPQSIQAPPAPGTAVVQDEINEILKLQAAATPAELQQAQSENHLSVKNMDIDKHMHKDFPKTKVLLKNVKEDCDAIVDNAKDYWHYTRPYLTDPRIKALISDPAKNYSYPSGHTTCSRVWAEVLSQLAPEQQAFFHTRADEIAHHRIVIGVHWPHDVEGGKQLALIIFQALQTSPAYKTDFAAAQTEWQK